MKAKSFNMKPGPSMVHHSSRGFTLIEVLMVIAILSVVFSTVYATFDTFNRAYTTENVVAGVQQRTRIGVEFMAKDIRLAGLDPLGTAAAGISESMQTKIVFSADTNYDGDVENTDAFENVTYELVGTELKQTNHLGQETLLNSVIAMNFVYLDADENDLINYTLVPPQVPANQLADIRTVVISLTTQRPAGRDAPVSRTYTTRVRCRNL
jgi:prepilin-type N-terminal cleavage/methylation domain-containing protein